MPLIVSILKMTWPQSMAIGSGGMPSIAIFPPWHILSTMVLKAAGLPDISSPTSKPSFISRCFCTSRRSPCFTLSATVALNVKQGDLRDVQKHLEMKEGFDVGLEMSGSPAAFKTMVDNMCHGGKIAMLGIPPEPMAIDWGQVIFNMLTIKGIYGREMYETWYQMTVMLQSGLEIKPVITHRYPYTEFEKGFEAMLSGQSGKVILDWKTRP